MADEVSIIRIETGEAVKNIAELKENVSTLKASLQDLEIGSQEYQDTLKELNVNQAALKNAMYATDASMQDVSKAAKGMGQTYNSLVKQMADYKTQLRNIDVSTDEGKKKFAEMAQKIDDVNSQLKAMDAAQGNYQRNVGNYQSAFKGLGEKVDGFGKGLKAAKGSTESLKGAMDAASKTPMLVLLGLVVSSITKLVAKFKESKEGTEAIQASMVSLEPIMNVFSNIFSKLADFLGEIVVKVTAFVTKNGLLDKVIKVVTGVGNVIIQYLLTPFKAVIAAIKTFQEEGIKGIGNAAKAFAEEYKSGFSFKKNFEAGQAVGDALKGGMKSKKKEVETTAKEIGDSAGSTLAKSIMKGFENALKWRDARKAIMEQWEKDNPLDESLFELEQDEIDAISDSIIDGIVGPYVDATNAQIEADKKAIESARAREAGTKALVSTTSSILGSLASIIEASGEESEKNAKAVKGLQIAQATINTISGAVGAFMGITRDTGGWGIAAAAAEAAAVTAAGVAQIANIKKVAIGTSTGDTGTTSVTAPSVSSTYASVRNITTQSEEDRLNKMAADQRVYILASDIQASQDSIKTRVAEASF